MTQNIRLESKLFVIDPEGSWSLKTSAARQAPGLPAFTCRLEVNGKFYPLSQATTLVLTQKPSKVSGKEKFQCFDLQAEFSDPGFRWTLSFQVSEKHPRLNLSARIKNTSASALVLGDCELLSLANPGGKSLRLGASPSNLRIFAFTGGLATQYVKDINENGGEHLTSYFLHLHDPDTLHTFFAGFLTFDRMQTAFHCRLRKSALTVNGVCRFRDFNLPVGASVDSETLRVELAADPHDVLSRWADDTARHYKPRIWNQPVPVGVIGGTWLDGRVVIAETRVENTLKAVQTRLAGFGINYLWISISNLKDGLPGNWLEFNNEAFPRGFDKTLAKIKRAGIKPGLWTGFFYVNEAAEAAFKENYDNLYRDHKTGKPSNPSRWLWAHKAKDGKEPGNYRLDCSHPASLKYLEKIYQIYRQWGVRYYMLDFLDNGPQKDQYMHLDYHDQSFIRGPGIPRQGMLTVRKTTQPDTHLLTASGSSLAVTAGMVDTMRIGLDYGEGRGLQPRFPSYPAKYVINGSYGSAGSPQDNCLQNTAAYFFSHRKFFLNGQNMLTVDHPIPRNEAEFSTTLFGMTGSSVMFGDTLSQISEERLGLLKKILPRPLDWPFPVDLFKRVYPHDYARVLVAPVSTAWGNWAVLAVFNLDDRTAVTDVAIADLRLSPLAKKLKQYWVWDFWQSKYCGQVQEQFQVEVPAKSCRLLRLSAVKPNPGVLSTDMHVRQGQFELDEVVWDKTTGILAGKAMRPKGEQGNLYLGAPSGWKLSDYAGVHVAKDALDSTLVIRYPLDFKRSKLSWSVPFEPLNAEEKQWQKHHAEKRKAAKISVLRRLI